MQWDFEHDEQGHWFWRCYHEDGTYTRSGQTFQSRVDCIADAMKHGFLGHSLASCVG
jgi:hypothetical protein